MLSSRKYCVHKKSENNGTFNTVCVTPLKRTLAAESGRCAEGGYLRGGLSCLVTRRGYKSATAHGRRRFSLSAGSTAAATEDRRSLRLRRCCMIPRTAIAHVDPVHLLIFDFCAGCRKMSAFPPSMHAVYKVRSNMQRQDAQSREDPDASGTGSAGRGGFPHVGNKFMEELPTKYSDKLMKSIWGFYNRYSVHNLKNIEDGNNNKSQQQTTSAGFGGHRVPTPQLTANWDAMWFSHI
ncbi:uncharacterized protein LOC124556208 [Schistocerca americana]|uniref:uncharacterized protein LOC124556208 n=1 Tax=Schistocerca americana TaxID=7009 RepID=UPI001F50118B|nr:uncharacterized protein LOC124556208 [Schistocerca americana]